MPKMFFCQFRKKIFFNYNMVNIKKKNSSNFFLLRTFCTRWTATWAFGYQFCSADFFIQYSAGCPAGHCLQFLCSTITAIRQPIWQQCAFCAIASAPSLGRFGTKRCVGGQIWNTMGHLWKNFVLLLSCFASPHWKIFC